MSTMTVRKIAAAFALALGAPLVMAQAAPYGAPIDLATAKKVAAAAVAEADKIKIPMVVAVTDAAGDLVYLEKMDGAQTSSVKTAGSKAHTAANYKRPTKVFQDILAGGGDGLRVLTLEGVVAIEGGIPLVVGGKIVGAIGTSGGNATQDGQVAKAGAAVVN